MKPIILLSTLALPLIAGEPNTLTPAEKSDGFKLIFDGKTLTGFRNFKSESPSPKWQVKNGAITLTEKRGGDLITDQQYQNFEFRFEFNIAPKGNSGIMWHVTEDAKKPYQSGIEYQILDSSDPTGYPHEHPKGNVAGAIYGIIPGKASDFKGSDQWNQGSIRIEGTRITTTLNGRVTAEVDTASEDWKKKLAASKFANWQKFNKYPKGHIAFQDHGDVVSFRSMRIKELP